jgi:hypothetical protein
MKGTTILKITKLAKGQAENDLMKYKQSTGKELFLLHIRLEKVGSTFTTSSDSLNCGVKKQIGTFSKICSNTKKKPPYTDTHITVKSPL